ncbi:hypothetical protein F5884DRAFT_752137 [Xylogone sp. PMI_703]|nr:hypothetical protein F5884DRAFT_752137 [Xylogone sp. PMI_703]
MGDSLRANLDLGSPTILATQACLTCRKQKGRCDKTLPSCSLCARLDRFCDYTDNTTVPTPDDFAFLRARIIGLESRLQERGLSSGRTDLSSQSSRSTEMTIDYTIPPSDGPSNFPPMFFLASGIYNEARMLVPKPNFPIPQSILEHIGAANTIRTIVDR